MLGTSIARLLGAAVLTSFCASIAFAQEAASPSAAPQELQSTIPIEVVVEDLRPQTAQRFEVLSASIANCNNGVYRFGDRFIEADRLVRLRDDLVSALGESVRGQTLVVRQYDIYLNSRAELEALSLSGGFVVPMGGGVPLYIPGEARRDDSTVSLRAKCERDRMRGGWFDTSEVENNYSPVVIELDVVLAGQEYAARSVFSPPRELFQDFNRWRAGPDTSAAVDAAITRANQALIALIRSRVQVESDAPSSRESDE